MRGIQFRGKRVEYGEWVYGYLIGDDVIVGNIVEFNDEYFNTSFWWKVRSETVGQDTGLKDRDNKEIYGGDIVKIHTDLRYRDMPEKVGTVGFEDGSFRIETEMASHYRWMDYEVEVIGNIHENHELLAVMDS